MKIIDTVQGSDDWLAQRLRHRCASEAAAANGEGKYMKRGELLRMKATGLQREFSDYVQKHVLDRGHENEARARALVEAAIGQELFPVTGTTDDGYLWASVDGLTMDDEILFESKSWNEDLAAQVRAGSLEPHYYWQLEQGLAVTGAKKAIFACSDGTPERHITMEYFPVPGRLEQLLAIWRQFDADLAAWKPEDQPAPVQKLVAEPVESLPAVVVTVTGSLALQDNFKAFEERLKDFLANKLIREPKTDQDFFDLGAQIAAMKEGRDAIKRAKAQMLAQVEPVDTAGKTADMLDKMLLQACSMAEKLLDSEKERRKGELVAEGITALRAHIAGLNDTIGRPLMPATATAVDFGAAIKGLRSLDSMRDAIAATLARSKIAANETAQRIQANLKAIDATGQPALFADLATLVLKDMQDCAAQIENRVAQARAAEKRREEEQRERIRQEEQAKADAKAAEATRMAMSEIGGIQQQVMIATLGRAGVRKGGTIECIRETLTETQGWVIDDRFGALQGTAQAAKDKAVADIQALLDEALAKAAAAPPAATAAPAPAPTAAPSPASAPQVLQMRPAAPQAPAAANDAWQPAETMPKEPTTWLQVQVTNLYRFLPYKPNSTEARRGLKGRWQRHNGYGFENCEPPVGPWRVGEEAQEAAA